jgi:hypothetical protein
MKLASYALFMMGAFTLFMLWLSMSLACFGWGGPPTPDDTPMQAAFAALCFLGSAAASLRERK